MLEPILNQKISQFLDDDLNKPEALQLLKALQQQPHLQTTMQRYLLINQALKSRPLLTADESFAEQIKQKLEQEPTYLLPQQRRNPVFSFNKPAWALAASLTAIAVILPLSMKLTSNNQEANSRLAQQQLVKYPTALFENEDPSNNEVLVANNADVPMRLYPVNQRFQDYLQAHNGSVYTTNGVANFQYRAQLASYGKGD